MKNNLPEQNQSETICNSKVHRVKVFSSTSLLPWWIKFLLLCVLSFRSCHSFLIRDNFMFCEIHGNKAIWDIPDSCQYDTKIDKLRDQYWDILIKDDMVIRGAGWICKKQKTVLRTYMDLLGTKTHEETTISIDLSREDCLEMVRSKKCSNVKMKCNGNYCSLNNKPSYDS